MQLLQREYVEMKIMQEQLAIMQQERYEHAQFEATQQRRAPHKKHLANKSILNNMQINYFLQNT